MNEAPTTLYVRGKYQIADTSRGVWRLAIASPSMRFVRHMVPMSSLKSPSGCLQFC